MKRQTGQTGIFKMPDSWEWEWIIELGNDKGFALVDESDFNELSKYRWQRTASGYARRRATKEEIKSGCAEHIPMHRHIMGLINNNSLVEVDHIFGNRLDNRKSKLRICTRTENGRNKGSNKNSKSGIKGVSFIKSSKRWRAKIMHEREDIHIGTYESKEDAIIARKEKELQLGWMPATNI